MKARKKELEILSALLEGGAETPDWLVELTALMNPLVPDRFWAKVDLDNGTGCWEWTAFRNAGGYGVFSLEHRRPIGAHRYLYAMTFGDPGELHVDHLCRNRGCCNPAHLEAVSVRVNVVERGTGHSAENARKTHCKWEHPLSGENLYMDGNRRRCRTCMRRRTQAWRARQKEAAGETA